MIQLWLGLHHGTIDASCNTLWVWFLVNEPFVLLPFDFKKWNRFLSHSAATLWINLPFYAFIKGRQFKHFHQELAFASMHFDPLPSVLFLSCSVKYGSPSSFNIFYSMCFKFKMLALYFKNIESLHFFAVSFHLSLLLHYGSQSFKDGATIAIFESFYRSCEKWSPVWMCYLGANNTN